LKLEIKPLVITDMTGVNYFKQRYGGEKVKPLTSHQIVEKLRQDFKLLDEPMKLKALFYYIKDRTKDGLYKKEDNRVIGEYFGVGKDTINTRVKKLIDLKYISRLSELDLFRELKENDRYYKLLKEDFRHE
jgi:hypothetical protein